MPFEEDSQCGDCRTSAPPHLRTSAPPHLRTIRHLAKSLQLGYVPLLMSTAQILDELPSLTRSDREKVWQKLEEIELSTIQETSEILDAIDAGRQSLRESRPHSIEDARQRIAQWTSKSS